MQYSVKLCSLPEETSDVISGMAVEEVDIDVHITFGDFRLKLVLKTLCFLIFQTISYKSGCKHDIASLQYQLTFVVGVQSRGYCQC